MKRPRRRKPYTVRRNRTIKKKINYFFFGVSGLSLAAYMASTIKESATSTELLAVAAVALVACYFIVKSFNLW